MKIPRRDVLRLVTGAALLPTLSRVTWAQGYPSHPVHIVVPFPAGGTSDTVARLLGQVLSERLGQPFVVENRPGAAANIATESVVRALPDGYTLLLVTPSNAINATLYDKLSFNFMRDIAPVAPLMRTPLVMLLDTKIPAKTVPEFIAYARANPGKLNMAADGIGSSAHVSGELFKMMAGIDMTTVQYRGSPSAMIDLIGGRVQMMFAPLPTSMTNIKAGSLRALAVTTAMRSQVVPDLPTVSEFLPGYEASVLNGVGAPKNTPIEIINRLNAAIDAAIQDSTMKARLAELGGRVLTGSPAAFGKIISDETEKWARVVKSANIKSE
jgi:tripartite-type tricarboxylate transporter receptor subunit TctC